MVINTVLTLFNILFFNIIYKNINFANKNNMYLTTERLIRRLKDYQNDLSESFTISLERQQDCIKFNIVCIKPICNKNPPPLQITLHTPSEEIKLKNCWSRILHYLLYEELYNSLMLNIKI